MGMEDGSNYFDSGGAGDYGDYGGGGGGYDIGVDYASYYGSPDVSGGLPPDIAPVADQMAPMDDSGQYAYDPSTGNVVDTGLQQTDLVGTFFDYYSAQGYDDATALQLAVQDATPSIVQETTTAPSPTNLPDVGQFFPLPYTSPYDYWQSPPYVPNFPSGPIPAPPPSLPPSPATTQPVHLPPACAAGTYHPYPIGHPSQDICVPFPAATTQAPKPPSGSPASSPPPAPKPPAQQTQQQCPQGYYRASNGQCLPIPRCTTPGTVYDQRSGRCVPTAQASVPGCPPGQWFNPQTQRCETAPACAAGLVFDVTRGMCVTSAQLASSGDVFSGLSNIPLWLWIAAAGLLLLNQSGGDRTTTVRYRRAT